MWRSLGRSLVYCVAGERDLCPACGSTRLFDLDLVTLRREIQGRKTGFVSGCDRCGLVFTNPQPSPTDLARLYSPEGEWGSARTDADAAAVEPDGKSKGLSWARAFEPIRDALPVTSPPAGARVMDFGCGPGKLLDALQNCGWSTYGIEPAMAHAFKRHVRLEDVPEAPTFDLIVANHVLEHTPDPLRLLRQFAAASHEQGFLFLSMPRLDTLPLHRDYKYVISGHVHVTAYTWPCVQTLLAWSGWAPVAPPPAEIPKGGGRVTRSRLRVIARRTRGEVAPAPRPGDAARAAFRDYYAGVDRTWLERRGLFRLAARRAESERRNARKAAKFRREATTVRNS
jgi:SAM-dependent methyltransferase